MKVLNKINSKVNRKLEEINAKCNKKERIYVEINNIRDQIETFKT
jgi:hypothetical protein